jgi:hypothetical protein
VHQSLSLHHRALAEANAAFTITPEDYLEKIFQVAFWLEPMSAPRAASFIASLVRGSSPSEITAVEIDYLRALAAHVGPSPRRVKRLVNSYRLLKARMSEAQLARFVTDETDGPSQPRSGPYQLAIGLLVIATGASGSAGAILNEIATCDPQRTFADLVARFRDRNHPDWTMAARVLETIARRPDTALTTELRGWARQVARFLLQSPPESHPAAEARPEGAERENGRPPKPPAGVRPEA